MNKVMRSALCLFMAFAAVTCACSLKKTTEADPTTEIISIGKESANLATFKALYDTYLPYMQYYGQDPLDGQASLESFQDWILDSLVGDIVTRHQARQAGFQLSEEQEAEFTKQCDDELNDLYNNLMGYAEQDYADDASIPVEAYFESLVNSESEYYTGVAMSWDDYKNYYREQARDAYIVTAYKDHVCAEFEPSEEEIESWYNNALDSDKANYADSPAKYKTDEELYELSFGTEEGVYPITFVPSGYSRVMEIIVTPEGELSDEYNEKLESLEKLKSEYADLAFEDALNNTQNNTARMNAVLESYKALKAEADVEFDKFVSEARNKIYMAYGELESGKPFSEVMLKYTEDENVIGKEDAEGCEAFRTKGQLISTVHESANDWSSAVKEQFSKLSKGEYSEVFFDDGSYHILYYVSDERPGNVPLSAIYDDVKTVCTEGVQNSQWDLIIREWKNDPELKIDMDIIRQVGINDLNKEE